MQDTDETPAPPTAPGSDMDEAKEAVDSAIDQATAGIEEPVALPPAGPLPHGNVIPAAPSPALPAHRPTGVSLLAAVYTLVGMIKLLLGLAGLGIGTIVGLVGAVMGGGNWGGAGWGFGQLITGIVWLAVAVGLAQLKPWGWVLALIGAGLGLLGAVLNVLGGGWLCFTLFDVLIPLGVLVYLFRPHVRAAFGR